MPGVRVGPVERDMFGKPAPSIPAAKCATASGTP